MHNRIFQFDKSERDEIRVKKSLSIGQMKFFGLKLFAVD